MTQRTKNLYNTIQRFHNAKLNFINQKVMEIKNVKIPINTSNHKLAIDFLNEKEKILQKQFGFEKEAQKRYYKTLGKELTFLKNILYWFNDLNLKQITKGDIEKVFLGIETGEIKTIRNKELSTSSKKDYYTKAFRGKSGFFGYINKNNLAKEIIIRKFSNDNEVRFFEKDTLLKIMEYAKYNNHKLAFLLLFDTGIEVSALCQLKKTDFTEHYDEDKKQYYKVNIRKEISKKNRQKRNLDIYLPETQNKLRIHLESLQDNDFLFNFRPPAIAKALKQIVRQHKLRTKGDTAKEIKIKDFRSSCATFLLSLGYNTDFIKVRLGHKFSSNVIDRYVSYLGIKQEKPRKEIESISYKELENKYNNLETKYNKLNNDITLIKNFITSNPEIQNSINKKLAL